MSSKAMIRDFAPLQAGLENQHKGQNCGWR
jgi:hypothetical protein